MCGGGGEARRSQWADYTQPERGPRQAALVVPRRCYKNTTGRKRSPENCCDCCVAENASRTCRAGIYEREVPSLLALGFIYRFTSGLAQAFTLHLFLLASFACSHHVPVPSQQMAGHGVTGLPIEANSATPCPRVSRVKSRPHHSRHPSAA